MNEKERQELRQKQVDEIHRSMGEFSVTFEQVCHALQTGIVFILDRAGLTNQKISQILLSGITAEPLRALFEALVAETTEFNEKEKLILRNALKRFQELTSARNDIIHGTWFIGWGNESTTDFSSASGMKFHKNKTGAVIKNLAQTAESFQELTDEARSLHAIFSRLYGCILGEFPVEKNFVILEDGNTAVPPNK